MKKIVLNVLCVLLLGVSAYADDVLTESGVAVSTASAEVKSVSEPAGPEIEIQPAVAENKENSEEKLAGVLPGIIVRSNKITTLFKDETVGVSVITENQIMSARPKNLFDAIKFERGLTLQSYGDEAMMKSVSLRGGRSEELLIMLDGRPLNSLSMGMTDLRMVNLDNVERVEIYRDAYSSLYGGSAFSGIINLISKTPPAELPETVISGKFGGYGEQHYGLNFGLNRNNDQFSLGAGKKEVAGKIKNSSLSSDNVDFLWKKKAGNHRLSIGGGFYDDYSGDPYFADAKKTNKNYYVKVGAERIIGNKTVALESYYNNEDSNYRESTFSFDSSYLNQVMAAAVTFRLAEMLYSEAGIKKEHYISEDRISRTVAADKSISTLHYSALYRGSFGIMTVVPSFRIDSSEKYGTEISPKISVVSKPADLLKLSATVSRGFRFPTFNETFYPADPWQYRGNDTLKPEHSVTTEAGAEIMLPEKGLNFRIMHFTQSTDDKIDTTWPFDSVSGYFTPQNLLIARTSGAELEASYRLSELGEITVGYSYSESVEKNKDASSYRWMSYNPMNRLNAKLSGKLFNRLSYFLGARYQTDSYSVGSFYAPAQRIPDLFYSDLGLSFSLGDIEIFANIENLTDNRYFFLPNYPMPERKYYAGMRVKFFD